MFQKRQIPDDIKTVECLISNFNLAEIIVSNGLAKSKNEFRRLATQGGVKINGEKITSLETIKETSEIIVQIGKKHFIKIVLKQ